MRAELLILPLLLVGSPGWASDAPTPPPAAPGPVATKVQTPEAAAEAALAVWRAKDDSALVSLAKQDDPDPWLVADELIRRGEHAAAEAFAKASPRVAVEKLPAYVASRRIRPDDPTRRERLAKANTALDARKPQEALDAVGAAEEGPIDDVVGVRLAVKRGLALDASGQFDEARVKFQLGAQAAEQIGWRALAASAYDLAARSAFERSALAVARDAWSRALAAQEALRDWAGAADTLGNIGVVLYELGDYKRALPTLERALGAKEALGDMAGAAETLGNIGIVHASIGNFVKALSFLDRALGASESLGDRVGAATTLGNIGAIHIELGDYAKALSTQERALAAKEALGDRAGAAATLGNIGNVHIGLGDYARALSMYERALAALEAVGDRVGAAKALANIGNIHDELGNHSKALSFHERALAAMEALGDRAGAATMLGNIGNVHHALGDYARAFSLHERAFAAADALGDRVGAALALGNLGAVHFRLRDFATALSTLQRALAAKEALGDRAGAAATLGNIGNVHTELGDYATARSVYERALAVQAVLGDKAGAVRTLCGIGEVHRVLGDSAKAMTFARRAVEGQALMARGLSSEEGASAREPLSLVFDVGARAAVAAKDPAELAYFLEAGRAGALLEGLASREALWSAAVPEALRAGEAKARAVEARAAAALRNALDVGDVVAAETRRAELESAQGHVAAVVARIQRDAKAGAAIVYPQPASLDDLCATLDASDVLVLYALFDKEAAALVVEKAGARIVTLGARAPIDVAAAAFASATATAESAPDAVLATLADLVVKPLGLPPTAKRVLVSPVGSLSYVPFAALLPERTIVYVPSGTTYRWLREEESLRGDGVLALGDPDYMTRVDERAVEVHRGAAARLAPLPGTRTEVETIADVRLLSTEATEARLRDALLDRRRWRAVHLACHGLVNTERPALSSLALTASGDDDGFLSCLDVFRMKVPADLVVLSACETGKGKVVKGEGIVGLTRAFMFAGSPRVLCSLWKVDDLPTQFLMTKFYELWNPRASKGSAGTERARESGSLGLSAAEALREAQRAVRGHEIEVEDPASAATGQVRRMKVKPWAHPRYWAAWVLWGLP